MVQCQDVVKAATKFGFHLRWGDLVTGGTNASFSRRILSMDLPEYLVGLKAIRATKLQFLHPVFNSNGKKIQSRYDTFYIYRMFLLPT